MNRKAFNLGFAALINAFPNSSGAITEQSQDVYFQMLQEIPEDLWQEGIKRSLAERKFFPTISDLGDACVEQQVVWPPYSPWGSPRQPHTLTWQQGLRRIVEERERLAIAVEKRKNLPAPVKKPPPDIIAELRAKLTETQRECDDLRKQLSASRSKNELLEKEAKRPKVEERRAVLREQMKQLGVEPKPWSPDIVP